jgi:hypothetical protein
MPSSTSSSDIETPPDRHWRRFVVVLLGAFSGVMLAVWLFVVLVDPFGSLPLSLPFDRGPVDSNARYAFPMLARDPRFDSAMLGTSTVRLLRPVTFDRLFGARFVNLAMSSATPYEQSRLLELFLAAHPAPRLLLFGVDTQWCEIDSYRRFTERPFPEWLYSGSRWAGYREMADFYSVDKAWRALMEWTGLKKRVHGRDGYTQFVPDDSRYDPARVAELMAAVAPYGARDGMRGPPATWNMPNMELMRDAIARIPATTPLLMLIVPVNQRLIAVPGTPEATLLDECKRRVTALADARGHATLIDFMIASPITSHDENYWDPWHYRADIAERIAQDVVAALSGRGSADYRVLSR